jgi:streptogramin lyase
MTPMVSTTSGLSAKGEGLFANLNLTPVYTNIWSTGGNAAGAGNGVFKISTTGTLLNYFTLAGGSTLFQICPGNDGNMWCIDNGNLRIFKITPTGTTSYYSAPNAGGQSIKLGPDGNFWYTSGVNIVSKITPTGTSTSYTLTSVSLTPAINDLCVGSDGNIWCSDSANLTLIKLSTSGTQLAAYSTYSAVGWICLGGDGNIWGTTGDNYIVKCTPTGTATRYAISSGGYGYGITKGFDGNVYAIYDPSLTSTSCFIAKVTPSGTVTKYGSQSFSYQICSGPDNNLWWTQGYSSFFGFNGSITKTTTSGTSTSYLTNRSDGLWASSPGY